MLGGLRVTFIPYDAQTLFGIPILVWLAGIGVGLYLWYWWKLRKPGDDD